MSRTSLSLLALLGLLVAEAGICSTIALDPDRQQYQVHPFFGILEDKNGQLTLNDVTRGEAASAFIDSGAGKFSFGFTDTPYWFRFTLENPGPSSREMILVLRTSWLSSIRFFQPDGGGGFEETHLGDRFPFRERARLRSRLCRELRVYPNRAGRRYRPGVG